MNDKFDSLLNQMKHEYDFYYGLSADKEIEINLRQQYKNISIIIAQLIESVDSSFFRLDYSYNP